MNFELNFPCNCEGCDGVMTKYHTDLAYFNGPNRNSIWRCSKCPETKMASATTGGVPVYACWAPLKPIRENDHFHEHVHEIENSSARRRLF